MLWALLGIWTSEIQRLPSERIHAAIGVAHICFGALTLILFWIYQWPQWHTPAILTSFSALLFVIYLINEFVTKRKEGKEKPASKR